MSWIRPVLLRPRAGLLIVFAASIPVGAQIRKWTSPAESESSSLNPHTFTPYTIVSKEPVSSTSSIFTLRHNTARAEPDDLKDVWKKAVWSIQVKQPQLQIARAYTPLPPTTPAGSETEDDYGNLRLLIRKEHNGEVSTFLHRLPEGSAVEIRGPNIELEIPDDVREVVFLAGGTGIAPAMQVAHALAARPETRMHILWASRRKEDCMGAKSDSSDVIKPGRLSGWRSLFGLEEPVVIEDYRGEDTQPGRIVRELEALREQSKSSSGNGLSVDYFVDEEKSFIKPGHVSKLLQPATLQPRSLKGTRLLLVSGPEGFIEYWAGRKLWADGREVQGPLGGVLSQLDLKGWRVWKL
ncbi:hypothetical protein W97_00801 [Coniosporium apollinis CBS 100218]|uniref:FAD-binding FR-type domain-containing protein n=1 Tax=Coniosporium apollinis (strain CBS 100218) TaxID=1168221 RepID=R7YJ11_CONA1|nr:uncharacterized protein W97_00801 [Coniosporium apollinis CBS 100218]EON61586.1 hypothetical protein W97_00801 [Coniosporium apollinis CBS 100218]